MNLKKLLFLLFPFFSTVHSYAQLGATNAISNTISSAQTLTAQAQQYVSTIDQAVDKVKNNNLYKALVDGKEFTFPIGILPASGDKSYAVVINKVFMNSDGMYAEVFMKIPVSSDKQLYFLADKVPYSRSGGFAGDLKLYLLKTDSFQVGKGYNIQFDGLEKAGTDKSCSVTFNCKGFKEATLAGAINFDKKTIVTDQDTKAKVSVLYYINVDKLSNLIIEVSQMPTFEFANLPGFKCSIPKFTLDHSDLKNAPSFQLPGWYKDSITAIINKHSDASADVSSAPAVDGPQWQGIYIPSITIDIPKAFKEKNPNEIVVINSKDLIIDGNGITALVSAKGINKTPFYDGTIKSWEYRVDSLRLNLIASSLSSAGFYGGLTLPISKKETQVDFGILITKNIADNDARYSGYVDIKRNGGLIEAQAFGVAKIKITQASLAFNYYQKQFTPTVTITGGISLTPKKKSDGDGGTATAGFGLDFANLVLSTKAPYIDIDTTKGGYCKMSSGGQSMSNFPVKITAASLIKDAGGQRMGLQISLVVQFQQSGKSDQASDSPSSGSSSGGKSGGDGFGGKATFTIWTKRNAATGKWEYDDFTLNKIVIKVDNDAFKLYGELSNFKDDKAYGTGYCGYISLTIMKGKLKVEVAAIFGRMGDDIVPDVDHPVTDSTALFDKIQSYRYWFVDAGITFPVIPVGPFVGINGFTGGLYHHMKMQTPTDPAPDTDVECKTTSGLHYMPNYDVHLGLLAGIGLQSVPTDAVFNGKINIGLEFSQSGGLLTFSFFGEVAVFTPPVKTPAVAAMKDKMQPDKLDGLSKPANQKAIKDEKPSDDAGSVRVKWFTQYDFTTETFIGDFDVYVNLASVVTGGGPDYRAAHVAVMFSPAAKYMYMGTPSDPASIEVIDLFKCQAYFCAGNKLPSPPIMPLPPEFGPAPIDYNAMETGAGLSFGVRVSLEAGFEGSADFGICSVNPYAKLWVAAGFDILITQTSKPVYCGDGDARGINNWYATGQAFIMGGINVGCKYKCTFVSGDFTLVSASISAYVFAQLPKPSYMKGAVSVEFDLLSLAHGKATFSAEFGKSCSNSELNKNIVFIESITPTTGSTDIDVTSNIVVNFAKPIEDFKFTLPDESGKNSSVQYRGFVNSTDINVKSNGKDVPCAMKWNEDKTKLTLSPSVSYAENAYVTAIITVEIQYYDGTWKSSGKVEKDTVVFKTTFEPIDIAPANIQYAYPMLDMQNYYKNESNAGYIRLLALQRKPMQLASTFSYQVIFLESGKEVARVKNVTVNNTTGNDNFTYAIPNELLQNNKTYTLQLTKVENSLQKQDTTVHADPTLSMGNYAALAKDTIILKYTFTTSNFSTFAQKVAYYNQSLTETSGTNVLHTLSPNQKDVSTNAAEGFSDLETRGSVVEEVKLSKALVRSLGADLSQGFSMSASITNFPDSVAYSYYSGKLQVQYDVFSELQTLNQKNATQAINCAVQQNQANCNASGGSSVFPKGSKYYYRLGYFLPGKDIKTSEVQLGFTLPNDVTVQ